MQQRERSTWFTLRIIGRYLWPEHRWDLRSRVVVALAFLLLSKLLNAVVPFLYKYAIDALSPAPVTTHQILVWAPMSIILAYGGTRVLAQIFSEMKDSVFAKSSQNALRSMALDTFEHLHRLSLNFHLDRQTGGLSRAIERGTKGLQFVLQFMIFNIIPTLLEIVLVTGILFWTFDWYFAAIILGTIAIYIGFTLGITEWRVQFRRTMNQMDSEANTKAIDSLLNYETVKYFGNEEHEFKRYDKSLKGYEEAAVRSQSSLSYLNVGQGAIIGLGLISVMGLAAEQIQSGHMSLGDFVLINTYLIQLYLPLNFLGFVYREVKQGLVDADKMFELLDIRSQVEDRENAQDLKVNGGEVQFDNVSFSYLPERAILKSVSFRVPAGKRVAIVGPSGSGKSTIARLLYRFYDVTSGSIRVDGQDLKEVNQKSLRRAIGVVPQDTVLFNDSIEYNIGYGRPGASTAEVEKAAEVAQIGRFIQSLPQKYKTAVGERGLKLSGGEKQRVAIARTVLKNPQILVFDEATSALDSKTEKEIVRSLREVSEKKTTLVIAHRLSTVVDCDQILVLVDGQIAERGTHEELLRKNGEYSVMWRRQLENSGQHEVQA